MRFVSATALALVGALSIAQLHAQQAPPAAPKQAPMNMQDTSRKVPGGGIKAPGWQGKVDATEAAKGAKIDDSKFVQQGNEIQVNLLVGGKTLVARLDPRTRVRPGEEMDVAVNLDNMHVFDPQTEKAIL